MEHHLPSTPGNVHWGLWDAALSPVLRIASGDRVTIETLSGEPEDLPGVRLARLFSSGLMQSAYIRSLLKRNTPET